MWQQLQTGILEGDIKSLARAISLLENEADGYEDFLAGLPAATSQVIGITGPPGAGKSTLTDALAGVLLAKEKKLAILCVDPSSPFNYGALLGDRIRMSQWYNNPAVFIRSFATRGALGGLNAKMIEITSLVAAAGYDYILIETVGVGQSEVEIAGIADVTLVTIVPEAGDEVQTMKAGLMEIADIFVVNKADRPGADLYVKNLRQMLAPSFSRHENEVPVIKTTATTGEGLAELELAIEKCLSTGKHREKRLWLLTEKAWQLLSRKKMKSIKKDDLYKDIASQETPVNLYNIINKY